MTFKKWNLYLGWLTFLIATAVYFITIEDTVSLWDCGEYITAAYKLEVGHPPGAPLFMVVGRLFSFFADPEMVAVWINRLSALCSSFSILFMFWSITLLAKKIVYKKKEELSSGDQIAILAAGFIGGLAYTFSESFWFSAVEGEVYAMASLFTAIIFWAVLKWDEEMALKQKGSLADHIMPDRWLLLIMFLLGLAIGVHLLGILVVPAIGFIIFFRYKKEVTLKGFITVGILSVLVLGFIQEGVIPGSIALASKFEVGFVNSLGLPFYSGTIFFFGLIVAAAVFFIRMARKSGNHLMYNITMGLVLLLIGYGSFAVIVIRSNANTPLDENDPENLVTLHAYLKREQYGSAPILSGPHWNSERNDPSLFKDQSPFYLRRFVVSKGEQDIKAFKEEKDALEYAKTVKFAEVDEKYFMSNRGMRENVVPTYAQTTFFPRMYNNQDQGKVGGYKAWSGYDASEDKGTQLGADGKRLPTFGENITYFGRYQVNWMYFRYFLWNFAGRQNDIQGHGDQMAGNWLSGFSFIDQMRLGDQGEHAPYFTQDNPSNNHFFFLPLILGLIGLFFHYYRAPKDAFVVTLVFLFTGLAIVVYLNQKPFEPRERDYAYAGSFYFFAMWIGLGVMALYDAFQNFGKEEYKKLGVAAGCGMAIAFALDQSSVGAPNMLSWLVISIIGFAAMGAMTLLKRVLSSDKQGAIVALALTLFVPLVMGVQGWDDHDRSDKTSARDLAYNYLNSCDENGILFTNGDNDTFPLWYMQEVEGKRTDVRVCNLSLMQTDWYTNQMKMKAYNSEPMPIKFREDQILMAAGKTDQVIFMDLLDMLYGSGDNALVKKVIEMRLKGNEAQANSAVMQFNNKMTALLNQFTSGSNQSAARLDLLKRSLSGMPNANLVDNIFGKYVAGVEFIKGLRAGTIKVPNNQVVQDFQKALSEMEKSWNFVDLQEAMAFVRDDANILTSQGRELRIFPSKGFRFNVNKENALKSGIIAKDEVDNCLERIEFSFTAYGLQRQEVMMLDAIANNEWERGIYYASPGGSDVSMALYRRGHLAQNGLAYELTPLAPNRRPIHLDRMYENLMKNYKYGAMNNPDVLTDYYTRRHTRQYRQHFEILADGYLYLAEEAKNIQSRGEGFIEMMRQQNRIGEANRSQEILDNASEVIADSKKKAAELIMRSVEVMPVELVFDCGEPSTGQDVYEYNGQQVRSYTDGALHNYVNILYRAGAKKEANELGLRVADQLESIIQYFFESRADVAITSKNCEHLFAAMDSYFKISIDANEASTGDRDGALAKRTIANLNKWYNEELPALYEKMENLAIENGESLRSVTSRGIYASRFRMLQTQMEAMATYYQLRKQDPAATSPLEEIEGQ